MNFVCTVFGRIWDLIVSVPDDCLSFYFEQGDEMLTLLPMEKQW